MKKRSYLDRGERLRFFIAGLIDYSTHFCWTDLVCWALRPHDRTLRDCMGVGRCKQDAEKNGACYCGKFKSTAR